MSFPNPLFELSSVACWYDATRHNTSSIPLEIACSNCAHSFPHSQDSKVLNPRHLKCMTIVVRMAQTGALNSLLRASDMERNPGLTEACYICNGAITTKGLECVKCSKKCSGAAPEPLQLRPVQVLHCGPREVFCL